MNAIFATDRRTRYKCNSGLLMALLCACHTMLMPAVRALPVARFKKVRPTVQVQSQAKAPFVAIQARGALFYNNVIRTGNGGSADILFSNGTQLAMKANSQIAIAPPQGSNGPLVIRVFGALSEVFVRPKGNTQIRTMAAIAAARGTQFLVRLPQENITELIVNEGDVDFSNNFGDVLVQENERSIAVAGQAPSPPQRVDVTGFLQWTNDITQLPLPLDLNAIGGDDLQIKTAKTQIENGDVNGARATLGGVPTSAAATLLGWLDLRDGNFAGATTQLQNAIERDANYAPAHAYLALAQLQQNQIAPAQASAQNAARLQPNTALTSSVLALVSFFSGDDKSAQRAAKRAGELDPLSPLAALVEGRSLLAQRQLGPSRDAFARAVALAPQSALAHIEYARALIELDQLPKAQAQLEIARNLDKSNRDAPTLLAIALQKQGEIAPARELYQQVLAGAPDDVFARGNYAQLLLENGELEAAQRELALVPENSDDPTIAQIFIRLSEIALYQQKPTQALEWAQRAVRLLPLSGAAHYQLGRVYLEQERLIQAEQQFRLAVVRDPQFDRARYALGVVRQKTQGSLLQTAPNLQGPAFIGSAGSSGNVQNLQMPGAEQRIQGFSGDPTVARSAVRSYGDSEAGIIFGENSSIDTAITHAKISNDRRTIYGGNLERQQTNGVRENADRNFDRGGLLFGQKAKNNPSSIWALADFENLRQGSNNGGQDVPFLKQARFNNDLQRATLGFNIERDDRQRTRGVLLLDRAQLSDKNGPTDNPFFLGLSEFRSTNFELRHDLQWNVRHRLVAGLSVGKRSRDTNIDISSPFAFRSTDFSDIDQQSLYVRDEWQASERLQVIGEMGLRRVKYQLLSRITEPQFPDSQTLSEKTVGVPNLVLNYRAGRNSELRLRARRLFFEVEDFRLLAPTDLFFLSFAGLPDTSFFNPFGSGRSVELEFDHTFANASLLTAGVFQRDLNNGALTGNEIAPQARLRGLQASYESTLARDTTFFVRGLYNSSRDRTASRRFVELPNFIGALGVQYFNRQGIVLQANAVYQSSLLRDVGQATPQIIGGTTIVNLRAAKRFGLRSTLFVEVNNALDKSYQYLQTVQPGRRLRVGAIQRF